MSTRGQSLNQSFEVVKMVHLQLEKYVLMYFPDPDSTFLAGAGAAWSWEIYNDTDAVIVVTGARVSATEDYETVQLISATYQAGKRYRVRIFDNGAALVDEWYFVTYESNASGTPPFNVAQLNNNISRIAGLLGLNQRITHDTFELGVPTESTVQLFDKDPDDITATKTGEYSQKKFLDEHGRVAKEVSGRIL